MNYTQTMGELSIADVVLVLKPLCDSFMKEPSAEKAEDIEGLVKRSSNTIIQKICENILYPIVYHLKNNTLSKDRNLQLVKTLRTVILKVKVQSLKLFYELYHCLRTQICQQKSTMELIETHEELKEEVVLCLRDLIKNCSVDVIESFYVRQHAALLSHGIYICVKIARLEKSTSLRVAAIEAVMTLLQVHDEADIQDIVLQNQVADVVMLCLPGIASGLLEVAVGSDIQHHKITKVAITAWSRAIVLVMQDIDQEETYKTPSIMIENIVKAKNSNDFEEIKKILETAKRTPEWYSAVSEKFKIIFTELDSLTKNPHYKVRKELVEAISLLLLNCSKNMNSCFQILLEILITLSEDENILVTEAAIKTLEKIQQKCLQDQSMKPAIEMLEENLYDLLTKMPRIIRTSGESVQLMWLNRLAGYLKILGKQRLSQVLLSSAHLRKLLLSLVYIGELDCRDISLLEDFASINFDETAYYGLSRSWKQFKFLFDSASIEKLYDVFKILGILEDRKTLIDSILKMMLEVPKFRKELILILNTILEVPMDSSMQMAVFKQVIEHYIQSDYWDLPIKVCDETTFQVAQNNVIQCCLLLEGLSIVSMLLQEKYQYYLLKTLYLVIERAGSDHILLRFIGLSTLETIAKSQKLNSIGDLFRVNVDYITYHVTLKLRRVERNPGVLDVVGVVTKYSSMDFLPHLKNIVDDLLLQSGSNIQQRNAKSFLKVFYAFSICVKRLTLNKDSAENINFENFKKLKPADVILKNFMEFYIAHKNSNMIESNNDELKKDIDENNVRNSENDDETKEYDSHKLNCQDEKEMKIPYFVSMIKDIMRRSLHFLPSQDFTESSLAMSILKEGVFILKDWENELLPTVHELWHPLVERFQNTNPLAVNQAWQLLNYLSHVSRDFIRSRTLKQVLPAISSFLKKSAKESYKKDSGCSYKYTQIFKLQKEILCQLGNFVKNLKLLEKETWDILNIVEPYLDCLQNLELQDSCVNMYKEISEYDKDLVWIKCVDIWNQHVEPIELENDFSAFSSKIITSDLRSNYQKNLQKILIYINTRYET